MQINSVSYGYNTNFNATARANLASGATAKVTVKHNVNGNIKEIAYEIWNKGKMLNQTKDNWPNIGYDLLLQSDYFSKICERLKLTDEADEEAINDAVFAAHMDEYKVANSDDGCDLGWSGADPEDAYTDVYPNGAPDYGDFI